MDPTAACLCVSGLDPISATITVKAFFTAPKGPKVIIHLQYLDMHTG